MARQSEENDKSRPNTILSPGTKIDRHKIIESLGGGIVEFYTATGAYPDDIAVVAVLSKRLADDRLYRAEFNEEAESVVAVRHPCVKSISRVREYGKRPYYVVEFVDSEAAAEYIKDIRQRIADEVTPPVKPVDWWNRYVVVSAVIILVIIAILWLIGKLGITG